MLRRWKIIKVLFFLWLSFEANAEEKATLAKSIALSYAAEQVRNFPEAIRVLMPIYHSDEKNYFLNLRLGYLFRLSGAMRNSVEHYEKSAIAQPKSLEPWFGLAAVYFTQQNWSQLAAASEHILKADPRNAVALSYLVSSLIAQSRLDEALRVVESGLEEHPTDLYFLNQKILCIKKLWPSDKWKPFVNDVLAIFPNSVIATEALKQ